MVTYQSGNAATQIDFILYRWSFRKQVSNVKVILGEECASQHRLLVGDFRVSELSNISFELVRDFMLVQITASLLKIRLKLKRLFYRQGQNMYNLLDSYTSVSADILVGGTSQRPVPLQEYLHYTSICLIKNLYHDQSYALFIIVLIHSWTIIS